MVVLTHICVLMHICVCAHTHTTRMHIPELRRQKPTDLYELMAYLRNLHSNFQAHQGYTVTIIMMILTRFSRSSSCNLFAPDYFALEVFQDSGKKAT